MYICMFVCFVFIWYLCNVVFKSSSELKFNSNITNMCKKAARQLNVSKRIRKHLDRFGKLTIYHSFIMSNVSYCPLTWHFCTEQIFFKLKKYKNVFSCLFTMILTAHRKHYSKILNYPHLKPGEWEELSWSFRKQINISFVTCFRILLMIHPNSLYIFMLVLS
jgi:hypothetical protein